MHKFVHLFKLGWSYKIAKATVLSYPPYQYTIEPTNKCNLACDFCPQSDPEHKNRRPLGVLTTDKLRLFLERMKAAGSSNRNLNFTLDGEPFLNRDFIAFIEMTNRAGYFPRFATNGTLLDKEKIDQLVAAGPFLASIDFASDVEIFEAIRGKKGHFAKLHENLLYLIEKSRTEPGVHLDIHDITSYAGYDPDRSLDKMRQLFPFDIPSRIKFDYRQFHSFCGHLEATGDKTSYRVCPYPWTQMAVAHHGDCVACCRDTVGRSVLGNVFDDPIMTVWNNDRYRQFRQNLLDRRPDLNGACKDCDLPYADDPVRWKPLYILRSLLGR